MIIKNSSSLTKDDRSYSHQVNKTTSRKTRRTIRENRERLQWEAHSRLHYTPSFFFKHQKEIPTPHLLLHYPEKKTKKIPLFVPSLSLSETKSCFLFVLCLLFFSKQKTPLPHHCRFSSYRREANLSPIPLTSLPSSRKPAKKIKKLTETFFSFVPTFTHRDQLSLKLTPTNELFLAFYSQGRKGNNVILMGTWVRWGESKCQLEVWAIDMSWRLEH